MWRRSKPLGKRALAHYPDQVSGFLFPMNLKKFRNVKKLYLVKAEYFISDGSGNSIILDIDYSIGKFRLKEEIKKKRKFEELKKDVLSITSDLLRRKSKANLVK